MSNEFTLDDDWVEFVGIWGSGKSTAINKLKNELKNPNKYKTTDYFYKLKKRKRLLNTSINILKTLNYSIPILVILLRKFLKGIFKRDQILISMIRAFFTCYGARLFLIKNCGFKFFLWEGEFHLIPFLDLSFKQKKIFINILFKLTRFKKFGFVILDVPITKTLEMIEKDQLSGKNIRFPNSIQLKYYKEYIYKSIEHQEEMISILKTKTKKIYRFNDAKDILFGKIL